MAVNPMDEDDPVSSVMKELAALQQQTSIVRSPESGNVRVKFEFFGERRMSYFHRPLLLQDLQITVKKNFGRLLMMLFSAGGNNDIYLPITTQKDVDQMVEFFDSNPGMKNIKISLKEIPIATSPRTSKKLPSPIHRLQSPTLPNQGRYSPPPGTIDEDEVKGHRGSITSLNSEGEFIPDKNVPMYGSPVIHSSSTSLDSSMSSPHGPTDHWYDKLGRVLSYPDDIAYAQDNQMHVQQISSGGTYPRRLHARPEETNDHNLDISRSFPRIRPPSNNSSRYLPSNSYFMKKSPNNMSSMSNCSSTSSIGIEMEEPGHQFTTPMSTTSFSSGHRTSSSSSLGRQQHRRSAGEMIVGDQNSSLMLSPKPPANWKRGKVLGHGAFGKVYAAYDADTGRELAVKQVPVQSDSTGTSKEIKALLTEIDLLRRLSHDRIVQYYGSCEDTNTLSVFMEYMPGGSVKDEIKSYGALTEQVTCKYSRQILEGLSYLHQYNILHRDIKGANVLRDASGNVKLGDFGAAKRLQTILTASGQTVVGTPYWMSPEVIEGKGYGRRADIWSLGCTVVEMLTTRPPWYEFEAMAALFKIATQPTKPELPPTVSQSCRDFITIIFVDKDQRPYTDDIISHKWFQGMYF
uniref:mitogen-activated protein kinase kinase kinase 3-like n=1 Tax=Styela clava TaxID=7725 RepID=UPI001939491B|nr:mitogen-activated protein kinase kinase kinase 3-like [Styela clava]